MDSKLPHVETCGSLEEVRTHIDAIDERIVALLAERGGYVHQAARFKRDPEAVRAPARVEQVIARVVTLAQHTGANPHVTAQVYRAMIDAFIHAELTEYANVGAANVIASVQGAAGRAHA